MNLCGFTVHGFFWAMPRRVVRGVAVNEAHSSFFPPLGGGGPRMQLIHLRPVIRYKVLGFERAHTRQTAKLAFTISVSLVLVNK